MPRPADAQRRRAACRRSGVARNGESTHSATGGHFGAASPREQDLADAFARHRPVIERAARDMLEAIGGRPVLLHSGVFRFYA
ncbi:DUF1488 family protein [Burkholderia ubonensis]|uniref:DUF1488 family protein n=1 Tax=Burkholderia ubonensis TaxID=101571 RepID=UPI0009B34854